MPESFVQVPPDSTGKRLRSRSRVIGASEIQEQYVIPTSERVVSNHILTSTFRTVGNTVATGHHLFSLENGAGSGLLVAVRRIGLQMDSTVALATVAGQFRTMRATAVGGGTALNKASLDTAIPVPSAAVVARGATASDGGAATAITGTLGVLVYESFGQRLHTAVGQVLTDVIPGLSAANIDNPLILRPGEALISSWLGTNPATNHYIVNCFFEEFTLP